MKDVLEHIVNKYKLLYYLYWRIDSIDFHKNDEIESEVLNHLIWGLHWILRKMPDPVNLMDRNSKKKKRFSSIPIVISGLKRSEPRSVSTDIRFYGLSGTRVKQTEYDNGHVFRNSNVVGLKWYSKMKPKLSLKPI